MSGCVMVWLALFAVFFLQQFAVSDASGSLFYPKDCKEGDGTCSFGVSYWRKEGDSDRVYFSLFTNGGKWVALGFSADRYMEEDAVTECVAPGVVRLSYTAGKYKPERVSPKKRTVTELISGSEKDGLLRCTFSQLIHPDESRVFSLSTKHFLFLATGSGDGHGEAFDMKIHNNKVISEGKRDVSSGYSEPDSTKKPSGKGTSEKTGNFFVPKGCSREDGSCNFGVSYSRKKEKGKKDKVYFELFTKLGNWVAVGFSADKFMGNDAVTECVPEQVRLSFVGNEKERPQLLSDDKGTLKPDGISSRNGVLTCSFSQLIRPNRANVVNLDEEHFLLLATGQGHDSDKGFVLEKHKRTASSSAKVIVSDADSVEEDDYLTDEVKLALKKAHGILLMFAWMLFVPSAICLARYMRNLWPDWKIFDLHVWFQIHRAVNIAGVVLAAVGLFLILLANKGAWSGPKTSEDYKHASFGQIHSAVGLAGLILGFVQPLGAVFRPHPGTPKRPVFNWVHRLMGLVAWLLAMTVWLATAFAPGISEIDEDRNWRTGQILLVLYTVATAFLVFGMEVLVLVTETHLQPGEIPRAGKPAGKNSRIIGPQLRGGNIKGIQRHKHKIKGEQNRYVRL